MKCMVIIFVEDVLMGVRTYVCQDVRRKKWNMISASGITGVASHGKHTRATEHLKKLGNKIEQNFPLVFLAENFVQFCSPIFSHVRWQCYPKESWFMSITWLTIDGESCWYFIFTGEGRHSLKALQRILSDKKFNELSDITEEEYIEAKKKRKEDYLEKKQEMETFIAETEAKKQERIEKSEEEKETLDLIKGKHYLDILLRHNVLFRHFTSTQCAI